MEKKQKMPHRKMLLGHEDLVGSRDKPDIVLGSGDRACSMWADPEQWGCFRGLGINPWWRPLLGGCS